MPVKSFRRACNPSLHGHVLCVGGEGSLARADLVNRMTKLAQLVDPRPGLDVGMVAGTNGPHAGGLIPCVALSGVLKVRVWPAWAVHADVARGGDMRTAVGLGHDSYHGNP